MRIETTAKEIRALLQLANLDARANELPPETYRSGRQAIRSQVARPLLERYHTLLEAGRWPVIAAIQRGSCSGCHVRLPTMVESQARRSPAVHTCPHCRRMLYAPELVGEDSSAASKMGTAPGSVTAKSRRERS